MALHVVYKISKEASKLFIDPLEVTRARRAFVMGCRTGWETCKGWVNKKEPVSSRLLHGEGKRSKVSKLTEKRRPGRIVFVVSGSKD